MALKYTVTDRKVIAKDAKCPAPSAHTEPEDPNAGKETGGSEIN